jgi:ribonuclease HI
MELRAILKALELTQSVYKECACKIISDSAYCVNTYNKWIEGWAANNWMRNKVDPVKNLELMKQLYSYKQINTPNFIIEKTAGHVGYVFNELADAAATGNRKKWNDTILQYKIPDISAVKNLPY